MSHIHAACVALAVATTTRPAMAQPQLPPPAQVVQRASTPIGLPEVLQVAIRRSPALTRAVIDVEAARADALAAQGLDDYTLTGTATLSRTPAFETQDPRGVLVRDMLSVAAGLSRGLPSGGTISANASTQVVSETFRPDGMPAFDSATSIITNFSANLTHPLLRGYGERIARADRRRAAVAHDVATLQQMSDALNLLREVIIAYWQVAYARQIVEIRAEGLRLANEQLRITQTAVRTGSVSPTEVLAAEQSIAVREQALLLAQVEVSQQSLDMRRRVGLEIGRDQIDLAPTSPLQAPTATYDVDATIARALEHNPLLALLEARGRGVAIDFEVAEDAIRPRLDVRATFGTTGHATHTGEAIQELGTLEHPTLLVGVEYEQRLGARAARGARDRVDAQRRRLRVDLEEARREITVSVAHAIDLLRAAQKRIEVSDRAIALARRTLEIQQTRFLNGKATNFDVVLRQDELQQASVNRALAVSDALAAQATIDALTGDLLGRHHVRLAP